MKWYAYACRFAHEMFFFLQVFIFQQYRGSRGRCFCHDSRSGRVVSKGH